MGPWIGCLNRWVGQMEDYINQKRIITYFIFVCLTILRIIQARYKINLHLIYACCFLMLPGTVDRWRQREVLYAMEDRFTTNSFIIYNSTDGLGKY